ncbi:MAG: hypothetical protein RMM98_13950 [Acidobacteriota bacterium]|nr:hypothetical protein [Blastocatellia bacterium]MDW8240708.1 hypothetical protein [Acidobacteriota bacterium]
MLIVTLGMLTVFLVLAAGIAPSVAQELRRERETEMLFRGQQIVDAIGRYRILAQRIMAAGGAEQQPPVVPGGQAVPGAVGFGWPQSLEQLVDGVNVRGSTRKVRLLRPFALKDPVNGNKPWRPVGFNDEALREFLEAYFETMGQPLSVWPPQFRMQYLGNTVELGRGDSGSARGRAPSAFRGPATDGQDAQPRYIFGVVSESDEEPLRDYYGLERYNRWVFAFIPELQSVPADMDKQIEMLSREVIYPTDPLALRQLGGAFRPIAPVGQVPGQAPPGGAANAPGPATPPSGKPPIR